MTNADKTLLDPCAGSGKLLIKYMKKHGFNPRNTYYNDNDPIKYENFIHANRRYGLGIPEENITCSNFLEWGTDMKFDVIVGNPPYQGNSELHQQFFNLAVDCLNDNGVVSIIQPATAYFSKKKPRRHTKAMQDNIIAHETYVSFVPGTVFKGADVATELSITKLIKNNKQHLSVTYGDKTYSNVALIDVNQLEIEPAIYSSIVSKLNDYIQVNGNVDSIMKSIYDSPEINFKIGGLRGHPGTDDFFTIVTKDIKNHINNTTSKDPIGLKLNDDELENAYDFFKTYIVRFCVSILKTNNHLNRGEFKMTPFVRFDKKWNDELLAKELGLTDNELASMINSLPKYY